MRVLIVLTACVLAAEPDPKPNFVFILIDDMGWTDVSCYGSKIVQTPHIDRLAAEGMKFTQAYSACTVCSPTRAAILTGKYPARLHLTDWIPGTPRPNAKLRIPDWTKSLPPEEVTLAEALKPAGYVSASLGKWHLGETPEKQGFDVNFGGDHRGQPPSYFYPYKIPIITSGRDGEYLTDRITDEAEAFIEKNKDNPFFLYVPHYAVHNPVQAKKELVQKNGGNAYAAMIESVDESVGRIVKKLDALKLSERTVVVFTSDNGGLARNTSNAPLRAGKGSAYEGGVRVPLIVRRPGVVKAGSVCETAVTSVDFFPTFMETAGAKNEPKDGVSLVPLLTQSGGPARDAIYWHYPHYHPGGATPYGAVRQGDLKLIEFFEDDRVELYDLKRDISEKNDLSPALPEKAADLRKKLRTWRASVGAQMPTAKDR